MLCEKLLVGMYFGSALRANVDEHVIFTDAPTLHCMHYTVCAIVGKMLFECRSYTISVSHCLCSQFAVDIRMMLSRLLSDQLQLGALNFTNFLIYTPPVFHILFFFCWFELQQVLNASHSKLYRISLCCVQLRCLNFILT